ncbi:fungal-specific transcription factor domain-containing protein [Rostrohypoxylon terebratum]|nr:fungal-specific transcription factor domain-containing protein [Rostrohypoxylon terebratum]
MPIPMQRQPRRRRRPALSCLECRRRKIKCNRNEPCAHCVSSKLQCTYKVYSDDPTTSPQSRQGYSRDTAPGKPAHAHSPVTQNQQLNPDRDNGLITEHDIPRSGLQITEDISPSPLPGEPVSGIGHNASPPLVGRIDLQPSNPTQDVEPGLIDILKLGVGLEKSSASSPINSLAESSREILARQLGLRGSQIVLNKTRMLGWSLRIGTAQEFAPIVNCYMGAANSRNEDPPQDTELGKLYARIWDLLQKCKAMARYTKAGRPSRWLSRPEFDLEPPPREVADRSVAIYFKSFESTYRILHEPTFMSEYQRYWDQPESVTIQTRLKVLLVIGLGSSLSEYTESNSGFRQTVNHYIYAAQTWLAGPLEKDRLNVTGVQIYCLTILARQVFSIGGDLVWISSGSLMHLSMQIGLHRDPKHLPTMPVLQAEIRRRLWATVLEITVQSSLDTAMPPRISFDDFDTEAPSNLNDDEMDESTTTIQPHPKSTYTTTSIQLALFGLLPTRLRILHLLNGLHTELSYLDALALSSEITDQYRTCNAFMRENEQSGATPFHRNLLDYLVRRFLIPLHCPFAGEARTNPLFYYSLKVGLDSALSIISPEPDEGFSRLMALGGGMFREGIRFSLTVITRELIAQLEAQRTDGTLHRNPQYIHLLKKAVQDMNELSIERIRRGETNVKGPMFLSMILAQAEAMEEGVSCDLKVAQSAKDSLELCYDILQARTGTMPSPGPTAGLTPISLSGAQGDYGLNLDFDLDFFFSGATDFS